MFRNVPPYLIGLMLASPAFAETVEEFDKRVAASLLRQPELVLAAIAIIKEQQEAEAQIQSAKLIEDIANQMFARSSAGNINPDTDPILVEFFDYRCGFCSIASETTAAFATDNDNRIRLVEFPILGPESIELAKLSIGVREATDPDTYFAYHNAMISQDVQPKQRSTALRLINQMSLDLDAILEIAGSEKTENELRSNRLLAQELGISGTPAYVGRSGLASGKQTLTQLDVLAKGERR